MPSSRPSVPSVLVVGLMALALAEPAFAQSAPAPAAPPPTAGTDSLAVIKAHAEMLAAQSKSYTDFITLIGAALAVVAGVVGWKTLSDYRASMKAVREESTASLTRAAQQATAAAVEATNAVIAQIRAQSLDEVRLELEAKKREIEEVAERIRDLKTAMSQEAADAISRSAPGHWPTAHPAPPATAPGGAGNPPSGPMADWSQLDVPFAPPRPTANPADDISPMAADPFAPEVPPPPPLAMPMPPVASAPTTPGLPLAPRILWVDDHPENNLYPAALLRRGGAEIREVTDTSAALAAIRAAAWDLVITDMGRREGADAGLALVDGIRKVRPAQPVMIFASRSAKLRFGDQATRAGVEFAASLPELFEATYRHIGLPPPPG